MVYPCVGIYPLVYSILLAVLFRLYHLCSTDAVTSHEFCFIKQIIAADLDIYDICHANYDSHVRELQSAEHCSIMITCRIEDDIAPVTKPLLK